MTNRTNKLVAAVAVSVLALGCSHDRTPPAAGSDSKAPRELPIPHKLPPPATGSAQPPPPHEDHAAEIDSEYSTVLAMYNAPEGATKCESAFIAITAEQDAAKAKKRASIFKFVAPKDTFMKLCAALPAASQQCLVPRYQAQNGDACSRVKPPADQLDKIYVLHPNMDEVKEPVQ